MQTINKERNSWLGLWLGPDKMFELWVKDLRNRKIRFKQFLKSSVVKPTTYFLISRTKCKNHTFPELQSKIPFSRTFKYWKTDAQNSRNLRMCTNPICSMLPWWSHYQNILHIMQCLKTDAILYINNVHRNSRQVLWLHSNLHSQIMGCEICGMCYSFSINLISMRLSDSVSIFTVWAVIKALELIKNPNTFCQTHFCISKLYNIWSQTIC